MKPMALQAGDVVQINPETQLGDKQGFFAGCFMTVTEPKAFGAQGYVCMPKGRGETPDAAYVRVGWDDMEFVGRAVFIGQPEFFESVNEEKP